MIANSIMHISRYSYQTWNVAWLYTCNFEKFHYYKQGQLRQTRINTRWTFLFIDTNLQVHVYKLYPPQIMSSINKMFYKTFIYIKKTQNPGYLLKRTLQTNIPWKLSFYMKLWLMRVIKLLLFTQPIAFIHVHSPCHWLVLSRSEISIVPRPKSSASCVHVVFQSTLSTDGPIPCLQLHQLFKT